MPTFSNAWFNLIFTDMGLKTCCRIKKTSVHYYKRRKIRYISFDDFSATLCMPWWILWTSGARPYVLHVIYISFIVLTWGKFFVSFENHLLTSVPFSFLQCVQCIKTWGCTTCHTDNIRNSLPHKSGQNSKCWDVTVFNYVTFYIERSCTC